MSTTLNYKNNGQFERNSLVKNILSSVKKN